jgi:hypothetical protein
MHMTLWEHIRGFFEGLYFLAAIVAKYIEDRLRACR